MKSRVLRLLTLLLTVFLLLSFTLSAFARRPNYLRKSRDLDEQPYPAAFGKTSYFIVLKTSYGFVLFPVFVKPSKVSNAITEEKQTTSSRTNEVVD